MMVQTGLCFVFIYKKKHNPTARSGFSLHTKSFTKEEVYKMAGILHYKFDLYCSVQIHDNKYPVIYIKKKSMENLKNLVMPYFHEELKYKLKENPN